MSTVDPGIGESVSHAAEEVKSNRGKDEFTQEEDDDYMRPSTWWFASTMCPLLGATFGPVANGFSICALVYPWSESHLGSGSCILVAWAVLFCVGSHR